MRSEREVRAAFWQGLPPGHPWRKRLASGDYCTDCRVEFVDFVDMLARDGVITEALAQRVTLGRVNARGQIHPDLCRMLAVAGAILTALVLVTR
jgi:hypothetical protein